MAKRKNDRRTNNDRQNTTQKTKDRARRAWGDIEYSGRISSSCSASDTRHVTLVTKPVISYEIEQKEPEVVTK